MLPYFILLISGTWKNITVHNSDVDIVGKFMEHTQYIHVHVLCDRKETAQLICLWEMQL